MIDTHAHLDTDVFDADRNTVFSEALDADVNTVLIPATEPAGFQNIISLSNSRPNTFYALGVHPHTADTYNPEVETFIKNTYASDNKMKAIGEIGLDYYYDFSPRELQMQILAQQLELAESLNLPVIIHSREADQDLLNILKSFRGKVKFVVHCFSSNLETAHHLLELGAYFSFTGNITFKKIDLSQEISFIPNDRIMLETDSPYMTPVPFRGKRNEPKYLGLIAEKIAEIKKININEVKKMTTDNAKKFFNLILITFFLLIPFFAVNAQVRDEDGNYIENEQKVDIPNPYKKTLGIGLLGATNTSVVSYDLPEGQSSITYEGIMAYGGTLRYEPFNFLNLEATYVYSKNTKITEKNNGLIGNTITNFFELTSNWIANPRNMINFYGSAGATLSRNTTDKGNPGEKTSTSYYLNTGLGLDINLKFENLGIFVVYGEWKLDFQLGTDKVINPNVYPVDREHLIKANAFISLPRIGIIFYPNFIKF